MAARQTNRADMPWLAGLYPESWSRDSLVNDLLLPTIAGLALCLAIGWLA